MYIDTNIPLWERFPLWHGSFHETLGKGGTLLVGHGIRRDMIGHPIPTGAAAGITQLDVREDSVEELSGLILSLSLDPPELFCKTRLKHHASRPQSHQQKTIMKLTKTPGYSGMPS
jgi:hypothetical protein